METWKTIEELPNYEVSDRGRIRSNYKLRNGAKGNGGIMAHRKVKGYHYVNLWNGEKQLSRRVARLVALAFIPGDHSLHIDHIDGDKNNNRASNLRWITSFQNSRAAMDMGLYRRGEKHKMAKLSEADVRRIKSGEFDGMNQHQIARVFGVTNYTISDIQRGKTWRHI